MDVGQHDRHAQEGGAAFTLEVAVAWFRYGFDGLRWFECTYDPDAPGVAAEVLDQMFEYVEPSCPCCEDDGLFVDLVVDEDLALGLRDEALNSIWRPCTDHAQGCSFDNDGTLMTWRGERWVAEN